jgi:succinate dehydrogenase/fumarate reductase flavoprotein subunit
MGRPASVIVVGSGAAGLAAALAATHAGASVTLVERATSLGGTTAISGGVAWLPASHVARAAGVRDSPAEALQYLRSLALGDYDDTLASTFVHDAARVASMIEDRTPLCWELLANWPDYHAERPGGRTGGRSIWPRPLELPAEIALRVQSSPEVSARDAAPSADAGRLTDGLVLRGPVRGRVLVGAMVAALVERGVPVRTRARAMELIMEDGGVRGVVVDGDELRGNVVLATGGFQFDAALVRTFIPGNGLAPMGTPGCAGDGLRMALAAGAELGNMTEAWWMPAVGIPGEVLDDERFYRPLHVERARPGAILVDRCGRRFVNEAQNYGDVGRALRLRFDAGGFRFPASPCWLVFDAEYRSRYPIGSLEPGDPHPPWLRSAATLTDLAAELQLPEGELESTVARFNAGVAEGVDTEFGRGSYGYDHWIGDATASHPTLGPVTRPPFYAVEVRSGCLGTKGGPRTDTEGRVRRADDGIVVGLYAAGNAAANPFGVATPAGGATIGPALVFGTRAGEAAAGD